jgi:hypothetical protein
MDIRLNPETWDLDFSGGDLSFTTGLERTEQFLRQRLSFFLAEWFLDESEGIDYFDRVLVKNPRVEELDAIFKSTILDTPGVLELLEFDLELDGSSRAAFLSFRARSTEGEIAFSEEIPEGA